MDDQKPIYSARQSASKKYTWLLPFAFACVMIMGVQLGIYINRATGGQVMGEAGSGGNFNKLKEIMGLIQDKYVDTLNTDKIEEDVINTWLSHLDPHSVYIPASEMAGVNEDMQGNFEGIGIEFHITNDSILVVTAIAGGPSETAGIRSGDKIVLINDTIVAGKKITNNDVFKKLRGPKGTEVKLSIIRPGEKGLQIFKIKRDKIPLYSVDIGYMVDNEIAYIKVNRFSATTTEELGKKLFELKALGMKKLILDLRQNPGGYLNAAVDMADEFLSGKQLVVYTKGKASPRQDYFATKPGQFEEGSICVLMDEGSASASEILAGAIQDHDRGWIIGRRSFGKGLVQDQYQLNDGSALRLTIARYYTPSGRCIQRSYSKGTEAYYNEMLDRMDNGEFFSADSIHPVDTVAYLTDRGRKVYAGGGITPDIFVSVDTTYDWQYINAMRRLIPEYVYENFPAGSAVFAPYTKAEDFNNGFSLTAQQLNDFYNYASGKGTKLNGSAQDKNNQILSGYLKAFIGRQKWQAAAYYPSVNLADDCFNAAIKRLKTPPVKGDKVQ